MFRSFLKLIIASGIDNAEGHAPISLSSYQVGRTHLHIMDLTSYISRR